MNQPIKPWLFSTVQHLNINEIGSHRMLCCMNILQNCTKLNANGSKEMLHVNKVSIPDMQTGWQIKIVNPTKHKAMLNSINRNNNRNHKSSLKCLILQDLTHSHCNHGSEYTVMYCNHRASSGIIFPVNLPSYTVGVRLATSNTLCLLCSPSLV